jgi:hypothetical protein
LYSRPIYDDLPDFNGPGGGDSIALTSITPKSGPNLGGTVVTLIGSNFYDTPDAMCRFGSGPGVFARYTGLLSFECISPSHEPAVVPVEISLNGQQFTDSGSRLFEYQDTLSIHSISPHHGPITGNVTVYVVGTHFSNISAPFTICRFYSTTSPATLVTSTMVKCKAPAMGAAGFMPVEVTTNLQDFTTSGHQFLYLAVTIEAVQPTYVSQLGGTEVVIHGRNFIPPTQGYLYCMFGIAGPTFAFWESSARLRCVTPPTTQVGSTPVYVFSNQTRNPFTSTGLIVFFARPKIEAVWPHLGPTRGGSVVAFHGEHFPASLTSRCFFWSNCDTSPPPQYHCL